MATTRMSLVAALLLACASAAAGQSTLERSPDLSGGWVGVPGRIYFHLVHRFDASPAPARKVSNSPTFLLGVGVPGALLGVHYATNSEVAAGRPNEWEPFARVALPGTGRRMRASFQAGYNVGAASADGELSAAAWLGPVRILAAARAFSAWRDTDAARFALAGGAVLRLTDGVALAADVAAPVDLAPDETPAWSAGLQLRLPYTPHTLSLQASNAATTTLEGATVGSGRMRWGFEFTIPVTPGRYLPHRRSPGSGPMPSVPADAGVPADTGMPADTMSSGMPGAGPRAGMRGDTVVVLIQNLRYGSGDVRVRAGTTVVWRNADPVTHSVTSDSGAWDSGLIQPGSSWSHTFRAPGRFPYHCVPHPFMHGVVIVTPAGSGREDTP